MSFLLLFFYHLLSIIKSHLFWITFPINHIIEVVSFAKEAQLLDNERQRDTGIRIYKRYVFFIHAIQVFQDFGEELNMGCQLPIGKYLAIMRSLHTRTHLHIHNPIRSWAHFWVVDGSFHCLQVQVVCICSIFIFIFILKGRQEKKIYFFSL